MPVRGPKARVTEMIANYGYSDGTGEYYITIDTGRCDGCGDCVAACPESLLELAEDDYGKTVAVVKEELRAKLGYLCPGLDAVCGKKEVNCHTACKAEAIRHSW